MKPKLTRLFKSFVYLYIILVFSGSLTGQELHLKLETDSPLQNGQVDSLGIRNTFKNYNALQSHLDSLSLRLERFGYLESQLIGLEKVNDSTFNAKIQLGNRWTTLELTYSDQEFSPEDFQQAGFPIRAGKLKVPILQLEGFLQELSKLKTASGTPFASIQLNNVHQIDSRFLSATIALNTREQRTIDGWVIKGYEKFPVSFLRYYAGVKRKQPFRKEKLLQQNEIIDKLGFVRAIKPPEALFKKDSTLVYFYFEKTNNNLFDGILGFATNEDTQKLEFNGYLNLELNNNLNYGERLTINYKADGREQQNFQTTLRLPYLFKTPIGVRLELKIFKKDSTFSTTEQQARIYYQTSPQTQLYIGYKAYESNNLLETPSASIAVMDFDASFFLVGGDFQIPQASAFFPVKTYVGIETEIGKRTTSMETLPQFRFLGQAFHSFNLNQQNSIYVGNTTGYLQSDNYLENDLFRFGGITSLRGFNENSIFASLYSVVNTEYRYQFNRSLYVNSLLDFGYFENEVINLNEELYSFGFGLGLNTNSGLLKLNIANGFSKNQDVDFAQTKVHLLFTTNF